MISQINLIKASRKYIKKNKNKLGKYEVDIIFHLIKIAYIYKYYLLWFKNIKPKSSMIFIPNYIINFAANINGHKTIFFQHGLLANNFSFCTFDIIHSMNKYDAEFLSTISNNPVIHINKYKSIKPDFKKKRILVVGKWFPAYDSKKDLKLQNECYHDFTKINSIIKSAKNNCVPRDNFWDIPDLSLYD